MSAASQSNQQAIGAELDVVTHHGQVHSNEFNREGIHYKFHLNFDCTANDFDDACFNEAIDQFGVQQTGKVAVQPFVSTDEFVAEAETRHEPSLFQPEYSTKRAREEDAFDSSKGDYAFGKTGIGGVTPFESPACFTLNAWYCVYGMEQMQFLCGVFDICVNEQGVCFAVDIFDCNLEAVETAGLRYSYFGGKVVAQVFVDNAVGCCKESKDMGDEVAFVLRQVVPVFLVG